MPSKRFKKLPKGTKSITPDTIDKLIPTIKKNCTTKFNESIDLNLRINNKQKKKRYKHESCCKYALWHR